MESRKSLFIDRWSNAESINASLGMGLVGMFIVSLILMTVIVYLAVRPRPVYFVPGAISAGVAYAQTDRKMVVSMFSSSWVLNWSNFTPGNVENVYKHAQQFMSPQLLAQTRARLKKDIEQIRKNNVSSLFSLSQEPQVEEQSRGFQVLIKGDKGIYMGREEVKLQKMIYRLRIRSSPPTDWNPYGLLIEDIIQEVEA